MLKTKKKYILSLHLPVAFLTLLTPVLFLFHADSCGTSAPSCGTKRQNNSIVGQTGQECAAKHYRSHSGAAHDANNCLSCQALLQYLSGAPFGQTHASFAPANPTAQVCGVAASPPGENRFSPFFSRAPPPSVDFFRS